MIYRSNHSYNYTTWTNGRSNMNDGKTYVNPLGEGVTTFIAVKSNLNFGLVMGRTFSNNTGTPDTRYQYNNKEMNSDLGLNLLDYGARWYDGVIGRWGVVDQLAHKTPNMSPYNYVNNNPTQHDRSKWAVCYIRSLQNNI